DMSRFGLWVLTFAVLAGFFILTTVNPYVFLFLLFWTFGLAAPLYLLNTIFLYFLAATPALICMGRKPPNWGIAACAAMLIPIVAVVPPMISQQLSVRHAQQFLADDINLGLAATPKSVELAGEVRR